MQRPPGARASSPFTRQAARATGAGSFQAAPLLACASTSRIALNAAIGSPLGLISMPIAPRVADVVDRPQHERIVDLARRRLVAAGMVGKLVIADQIVILPNVAGQVALADLLVVDVEEHLDVGRADGLEDARRVRRVDDELPRMIDQDVQRLEDDGDALRLDDPGPGLERGDDGLRLLVARMRPRSLRRRPRRSS